jgi:mRNA-degrading endonuclease toxin of MazEF toxin-antitoxin module
MSSKFGDVVLVPFPFTDQTTSRKRPAVVVSSSDYSLHRPDVILMAVTSQVRSTPLYGEIVITEWRKAGLVKPSVIKPSGLELISARPTASSRTDSSWTPCTKYRQISFDSNR